MDDLHAHSIGNLTALAGAVPIRLGQLNLDRWPVTGSTPEPGDDLGNRAKTPVHIAYVPQEVFRRSVAQAALDPEMPVRTDADCRFCRWAPTVIPCHSGMAMFSDCSHQGHRISHRRRYFVRASVLSHAKVYNTIGVSYTARHVDEQRSTVGNA